jgi:DNA-binding Xre family transcriptional regulator
MATWITFLIVYWAVHMLVEQKAHVTALQAAEKFNEATIIALTKHKDARVRKRALKELCPCRVKDDVAAFWERVLGECLKASQPAAKLSPSSVPQLSLGGFTRRHATRAPRPVRLRSLLYTKCMLLRFAEMVDDEDDDVRRQVLHTLCDGSPAHMEDDVMQVVGGGAVGLRHS